MDAATAEAREKIGEYIEGLCVKALDTDGVIVRRTTVGAILSELDCIVDYGNLLLNGKEENICPADDEIPVLGEVNITA